MKFLIALLFPIAVFAQVNVEPIAIVHSQNGAQSLVLQEVRGPCPPGTFRGYLVTPALALIWQGCYIVEKGHVRFVDEDGDELVIPISAFQWKPGKEPKTS